MKIKLKAAIFHCGTCRKKYSNPFGHVCVTRLDKRARTGKTTVKPTVTVTGKCSTCHKPMGNPATHTCMVPTDFKKKKARAAKAAQKPKHLYQTCRDEDCHRVGCVAYRDGRRDGYDVGFPDGIAACPLSHGGK